MQRHVVSNDNSTSELQKRTPYYKHKNLYQSIWRQCFLQVQLLCPHHQLLKNNLHRVISLLSVSLLETACWRAMYTQNAFFSVRRIQEKLLNPTIMCTTRCCKWHSEIVFPCRPCWISATYDDSVFQHNLRVENNSMRDTIYSVQCKKWW